MGFTKLTLVVAVVVVIISDCFDTAWARINSPPVIVCKTEFGYTGTNITITAPLATASGVEGTLTITPATTASGPHLSYTNLEAGVITLGTFTVVDGIGRTDSCTATLTVVEPPEIKCSFTFSTDHAGAMRTLSLPGPVANAKKGQGALKITPESVSHGISHTLEVPWVRMTTFTVTDEGNMSDSCDVVLEVFVSDTDVPTPSPTDAAV